MLIIPSLSMHYNKNGRKYYVHCGERGCKSKFVVSGMVSGT